MKWWHFRDILTLVWLSSATLLNALYSPPFDLDRSAGTAHTIVVGVLKADSIMEVTDVLKGTVQIGDHLQLDGSGFNFRQLAKTMGESGDVGMVGFLSEPLPNRAYRLSSYFVGISSAGRVFTWLESLSMAGSNFEAHPTWTKASFTADIRRRIQTKASLDAILAQPRSGQRMGNLIDFLMANTSLEPTTRLRMWHRRGYLFDHALGRVSRPSAEEERIMMERLVSSAYTSEQALILDIMAGAHASTAVFQTVRTLVTPETNPVVRRAALEALAAVDPYPAAGVLSAYLGYDEPELDTVITALGACGNMPEPKKLNIKVVEPLLELARKSFDKCRVSKSDSDGNRGRHVLWLLNCHFHPSFLPLMVEWAHSSASTSAQADNTLRTVLGTDQQPDRLTNLGFWWKENEQRVTERHALGTWEGVQTWLRAYGETNDVTTRHTLMRLWDYESSTPEEQLLKACYDRNQKGAKELLSELWQRKRVSPNTRMVLFRDFVTMKLVEDSRPFSEFPNWREMHICGEKGFPFPPNALVCYDGDMSSSRVLKIEEPESSSSASLEGTGFQNFHGVSGSVGENQKGIIEMWEEDRYSKPRRELWRLRWEVDEKQGSTSAKVVFSKP